MRLDILFFFGACIICLLWKMSPHHCVVAVCRLLLLYFIAFLTKHVLNMLYEDNLT